MTQKLTVRIIKPEHIILEEYSDMVVIPGSEGELGVMPGHVPIIVELKNGKVKIHDGTSIKEVIVNGGIAKITHKSVDVLCE